MPLTQPATKTCVISFTVANVSKTFKRVNPRKAAGPVGIPSRVLGACADQLAGVFTDIFNQSLSQSVAPTCFKMATIVPVPKKAKVTELNDHRPIALTSVIMKCFERLVKDHITNNDETAYREEVRALGVWCQENNLSLNVNKTKEMIVETAEGAHPYPHRQEKVKTTAPLQTQEDINHPSHGLFTPLLSRK